MKDANGRLSLSEGFMEAVRRKNQESRIMSNDEWDLLDRKALGSIWLCLAPSVDLNITKTKKIEDLIKTLVILYEKPYASNKIFLMKRLFNMKMVAVRSVVDHLNESNTTTS